VLSEPLVKWLLAGDVSIQFQVQRDLLGREEPDVQARIAQEGWGRLFLDARNPDGHWGRSFYQPKWISTHYTLLDLKHLQLPRSCPAPLEAVQRILEENIGPDGGVNPARTIPESDVCVTGMFLNYACYFGVSESALHRIIDFVIDQQVGDGGFNCDANRMKVVHSSLHSTISVLEGLQMYLFSGGTYRRAALEQIAREAGEFILQHQLFLSDRTGEVIHPGFLMLSFPSRWKYDILRALDYFRSVGLAFDPRLQPALEVLLRKRRKDGTWPVQARHAGQTHFEMEKTGGRSRWNTLRALRVLDHFGVA
jgi:hypothetical protein